MGWEFLATGEVPRVTEGGMEGAPWGLPGLVGTGDILLNMGWVPFIWP